MKYSSYSFPVTQYSPSRYSSYTPSATHSTPSASLYTHTPSTHTHTSYTPSSKLGSRLHSSSDISSLTAKYLPASYTSPPSHYTPSHTSLSSSSSSYSSLASYFRPPRYTPARKPSGKATTATAAKPNPDSAPQPVKQVRTVRFPNDIMFQDFVRKGELEQIGRFMRARKVRLDKLFLSGMAPLHEAVLSGNLECVKLLVTYGADVHQRDEDGWTPLHMACSDGFPEIAKYLLSMGASTEAENVNGDKPADLIDPDYKDLVKMFEVGCV